MIKRVLLLLPLVACTSAPPATPPVPEVSIAAHSVIPLPVSVQLSAGEPFRVDSLTAIYIDEGAGAEVANVAGHLQAMLSPPVRAAVNRVAPGAPVPAGSFMLRLDADASKGAESYEVDVSSAAVTITARTPAGLFYGVQTVRQLMPASVEHPFALSRRLTVPAGRITDSPRFEWRGMMLDVSRHFLGVRDVKRFVDLMSLYKLNRLHLHLSDDQGWRIEIKSRPNLTAFGGRTQVGGGAGGFYTQEEYREIVAYAASRFITIVPEIDMPGHTNAALASIPELNCDGVSPPPYFGIRVGFSALCVDSARIYPIIDDVVREISAMTPGPWFHIGGDEVEKLSHEQYVRFIERMEVMVGAHGKKMIGWGEIAPANLSPSTIVQHWKKDSSFVHAARGGKVIMSPSSKVYLDMKYDSATTLGLRWAGLIPLMTAYDWDPATFFPGVGEDAVIGVEAPLWSETLLKVQDFEFLAFPRLIAVSEVAWTRAAQTGWDGFSRRLEMQSARLDALGINRPRF